MTPVEIEKYVSNIDYPISKRTIIETAQHSNAPREVVDVLDRLPEKEYGDPTEVSEALGVMLEDTDMKPEGDNNGEENEHKNNTGDYADEDLLE